MQERALLASNYMGNFCAGGDDLEKHQGDTTVRIRCDCHDDMAIAISSYRFWIASSSLRPCLVVSTACLLSVTLSRQCGIASRTHSECFGTRRRQVYRPQYEAANLTLPFSMSDVFLAALYLKHTDLLTSSERLLWVFPCL